MTFVLDTIEEFDFYDLSVGSIETKNWKQKLKTKFFVNKISTLLYYLKKKTFLPFCFLVPPIQSV